MQTVRPSLSRNAIKIWAMLAMVLNHVAAIFLPSGTFWWEALTDIGYFTAITMCYFLAEGYAHTLSRPRYALGGTAGLALSGLCVIYCYSGQRGWSGPASKWFFYIFYPAHLLALGGLRLALTL